MTHGDFLWFKVGAVRMDADDASLREAEIQVRLTCVATGNDRYQNQGQLLCIFAGKPVS